VKSRLSRWVAQGPKAKNSANRSSFQKLAMWEINFSSAMVERDFVLGQEKPVTGDASLGIRLAGFPVSKSPVPIVHIQLTD
jgi:hypothetical protein